MLEAGLANVGQEMDEECQAGPRDAEQLPVLEFHPIGNGVQENCLQEDVIAIYFHPYAILNVEQW